MRTLITFLVKFNALWKTKAKDEIILIAIRKKDLEILDIKVI